MIRIIHVSSFLFQPLRYFSHYFIFASCIFTFCWTIQHEIITNPSADILCALEFIISSRVQRYIRKSLHNTFAIVSKQKLYQNRVRGQRNKYFWRCFTVIPRFFMCFFFFLNRDIYPRTRMIFILNYFIEKN